MRSRGIESPERKIGPGWPCFVIAEAGVNHNGDLALARQMVDVASQCGADAIKFQTFKAERLVTSQAPKARYQAAATGRDETQLEMLRRLELDFDSYPRLLEDCRSRALTFMSTPFDSESADFLDQLGMTIFKIASGEITNLPFLKHVAGKGKPMILSTGMSTLGEVDQAVQTIRGAGNEFLAVLQCTSEYPAAPQTINLRAMTTMAQAFAIPVGFSDHSEGIEIALAAAALGANIIEKHFTLDKNLPGPDHRASLEPEDLAKLVAGIRKVEAALGHGRKEPADGEMSTAAVVRKSLASQVDIPCGTILAQDHITTLRPGTGLPPSMLAYVLGRKAKVAIPAGRLLSLDMLE